ncbi:DNA-binding response regulator, NarL/FixJ family, contains REC and HTH domains [Actinokineospora alba]|uniref:DNA-binding response regulator, NarL/FixJ family, contains REC and HTH domains n=1 Tax=Actinokineospora alba TaxID=504798 RepID=A0A1H0VHN9_9PSEU|nr:response regulator transcription factor [Actinokineospora alba]TDP67737.1 LuxR family two component transcriptional regulator [Actinokineospora alba]SDJ27048.1 DNA-binding response regulator, NarL/FixJ family, contains REC and HTH domains [Actinokineospora alba]SDP77695.1 DNA-binding response regulator, NarL/FixJ family, contains REC and HTH domains [Actinokineospora alba]
MPIRVLLADDEPMLRAAVRLLLGQAADIEVVAEAADGAEAVSAVRRLEIDVALVDIRMPAVDGLAALKEIVRIAPSVRVIMLTTFGEEEYVDRALRAGAAGFLLKDTEPGQILHAVRAAAAGDAVLSPGVARQVIDRALAGPSARAVERLSVLSPREREVLVWVGHGLSNASIGARLGLSAGTVKVHVSQILGKLGCANRVQAAIVAHEAGLLDSLGAQGEAGPSGSIV